MQQNRPLQLFAAPTLPQQTQPPAPPQAREPAGSPASPSHIPIPADMSSRPITEQAILSALQAMATNPDYSDFMRTMEQHWPGLRTITLPHISIPNLNSIPHANTASDQPGHPQKIPLNVVYHSPSRASNFSQRGEGGTPTRIQETQ